jgi:hypothetical protein
MRLMPILIFFLGGLYHWGHKSSFSKINFDCIFSKIDNVLYLMHFAAENTFFPVLSIIDADFFYYTE